MAHVSRDVIKPILCLCKEVDTPRSMTVKLMVENGEWDQLVDLTVDPRRYASSNALFRDSLVTELLRKCDGLPTTRDKKAAALEAFYKSERDCYQTNERLAPYLFGLSSLEVDGRVWEIVSLARKYLAFVLGSCPDTVEGRFGPGSTYGDRGKYITVPDKMSSQPTLSSGAFPFLVQWTGTLWAQACGAAEKSPNWVRGNRFTSVPKDSTKERGIAIEPSINLYYQLGYGEVIRRRLKAVGIDLDDGQDKHRMIACAASVEGLLVTIDLSSASDTVCRNLCQLLLPQRWFEALDMLRSPFTQMPDGRWVKLEKFSSMGNGFTFELETALFLAISFAVMTVTGAMPREGQNLLVYGDDIIVPQSCSSDVLGALRFFGFTPNAKKTFVDGSFRESCGGDFFDGRSVRAFYLKELPNEPHQWISWANGLRRVVEEHHGCNDHVSLNLRSWRSILDAIPADIRRCRGPQNLGDIVIHDIEASWQPHHVKGHILRVGKRGRRRTDIRFKPVFEPGFDTRSGDGIRWFKTWSPVKLRRVGWKHFRPEVVLATAVYGVGDSELGITPRDAVIGYGHRWVPCS